MLFIKITSILLEIIIEYLNFYGSPKKAAKIEKKVINQTAFPTTNSFSYHIYEIVVESLTFINWGTQIFSFHS